MALTISTSAQGTAACIRVSGEVDVSNAPELRQALDAALAETPATVEVDFADVSYIDSTGIGVLVGAAHRASEQGTTLSVANPQRNVERVLTLLGVGAELHVHVTE